MYYITIYHTSQLLLQYFIVHTVYSGMENCQHVATYNYRTCPSWCL